MKRKPSGEELQSLLDAIKTSEVVESRTQLIAELGELDVTSETERASLLECLTIFWEDFTCLDVSQCMLNKTILQVATIYLESDISRSLSQLLALGTKASVWCRKHLKMTLMSTGDSQEEEHYGIFFQVLLDMLGYSSAALSALARYPVSTGKELIVIVETSILEFLNLTKDSIVEVKRIHTLGSEILKTAQVVLDAVIRLCRVYCNDVKLDLYDARTDKDVNNDGKSTDDVNHVISITRFTVEHLCGLGILAANDGGSLVSVLNLSWKGVVTLLQLGKGTLAIKLNIAEIILSLISLANGSLRCAAETWSSSVDAVSVTEAKRIFLPVKFYLINAARIISHYPSQAFSVFKDIILLILMILTFRILLGKDELLKYASQTLAELLEPASYHLLNPLLNSAQVKQEHKSQILDWLFSDIAESSFEAGDHCSLYGVKSMDAVFSVTCATMHSSKIVLLGRVALFINLLKSAHDLGDDVKLEIAKKLEWLLNVLTDEDVYSSILVLPVPVLDGSGPTHEVAYPSMFSSIIHAMKTFMLAVSSTLSWQEVESFLLENFFHPHPLCWEVVMELFCFMVRHAETDLRNDIIDKLCSLLRIVTSSESALVPGSALRKLARSICTLLACGSESMVDRVFNFVITNGSKSPSTMYVALLMEGFPLDFLSDKFKSVAKQKIVADYYGFLESFDDESSKPSGYGMFGAPVFALSSALQSLQVSISDTEMKTVELLIAVIHKYRNTGENIKKDQYRKLLSETLGIFSSMKHLYASDEMEKVILELQNLFISESAITDSGLFQCKPNLAAFLAGLGHIEFEENDSNAKVSASWQLFHMLLKERHWALTHLALTAFGYFSARTNCNELWRFVPQDAALSYDLEFGNDANEERFMSEFKVFLEKEVLDLKATPSINELELLFREGLVLKEMVQKIRTINKEDTVCNTDAMEVDDIEQTNNKRRKVPDGISKGVSLLQSGLKVIADGLTLWQQNQLDYADVHSKFLTHFSRLEDAVGHLASIAETE